MFETPQPKPNGRSARSSGHFAGHERPTGFRTALEIDGKACQRVTQRNRRNRQGVIETTTERPDHQRLGCTPGSGSKKRQFGIDLVFVYRMTLAGHVRQICYQASLETLTRVKISDPQIHAHAQRLRVTCTTIGGHDQINAQKPLEHAGRDQQTSARQDRGPQRKALRKAKYSTACLNLNLDNTNTGIYWHSNLRCFDRAGTTVSYSVTDLNSRTCPLA
jgi:hypothetical protein